MASSNSIIGEFFKTALAIEILCFCPPDNRIPFSPISVSYDFGRFLIKSLAAANSHAFLISSSESNMMTGSLSISMAKRRSV